MRKFSFLLLFLLIGGFLLVPMGLVMGDCYCGWSEGGCFNGTEYGPYYPTGPGTYTNISYQFPNSGEHWEKVTGTDGNWSSINESTYVWMNTTEYQLDLYEISDLSALVDIPFGYCTSPVAILAFDSTPVGTTYFKMAVKTHGQVYYGYEYDFVGVSGGSVSSQGSWNLNPYTGTPWTEDETNEAEWGFVVKTTEPLAKPSIYAFALVICICPGLIEEGDSLEGGCPNCPPISGGAPAEPSSWWGGASGEGLPLQASFQRAADSLGWTLGNTYLVMWSIAAMVFGIAVFAATGSILGGILTLSFGMAIGGAVGGVPGIVPLWAAVIFGVVGVMSLVVARSI